MHILGIDIAGHEKECSCIVISELTNKGFINKEICISNKMVDIRETFFKFCYGYKILASQVFADDPTGMVQEWVEHLPISKYRFWKRPAWRDEEKGLG
jgi:hypothetical protein